MLEARNLTHRFTPRDSYLFRDIDLSLTSGEILGLFGPSGTGKSTIARILAGYLVPEEGEVLLDGAPLPDKGFCPVQLLFQHPELSVNPRWKAGKIISEAYTPAEERLSHFEIDATWLERFACELSGGQLSRICLVRALSPDTRFLVADEITTMLDASTQARVWKMLLTHIEQNGIGLLVISHDRLLLEKLCARILTFN
jgi:ABC-type dipeptide/oligopeptide/nickel transport system ATPase subunit